MGRTQFLWSQYCAENDPTRRADDVAALGACWDTEPGTLDLLVRALGDLGACREEPSLDEVKQHVVRVGEKARVQLLRHPERSLPAVAMLLEAPEASEQRLPPSPHYDRVAAQRQAVELLDRCRPRAGPYVPSVVATMAAFDPELRAGAARCLGRIAAGIPPLRPVIRACFDSADAELKAGALRACAHLQAEDLTGWGECFAALLSDARLEVREDAARQLKRIGRAGRPFLPQIAAALARAEPGLTDSLFKALKVIDACDGACFEAIGKVFDWGNRASVGSAFGFVGHLGPRAAPLVPKLTELALKADARDALAYRALIAKINAGP